MLAGDLVFRVPQIGSFVRRMGNAVGRSGRGHRPAQRWSAFGGVPRGVPGDRQGVVQPVSAPAVRPGGFVRMALLAGAPLVPVGIVGAEEIYPMIANARPLAERLGWPDFPITPTFPWLGLLGLLPLPARCQCGVSGPHPDHRLRARERRRRRVGRRPGRGGPAAVCRPRARRPWSASIAEHPGNGPWRPASRAPAEAGVGESPSTPGKGPGRPGASHRRKPGPSAGRRAQRGPS